MLTSPLLIISKLLLRGWREKSLSSSHGLGSGLGTLICHLRKSRSRHGNSPCTCLGQTPLGTGNIVHSRRLRHCRFLCHMGSILRALGGSLGRTRQESFGLLVECKSFRSTCKACMLLGPPGPGTHCSPGCTLCNLFAPPGCNAPPDTCSAQNHCNTGTQ